MRYCLIFILPLLINCSIYSQSFWVSVNTYENIYNLKDNKFFQYSIYTTVNPNDFREIEFNNHSFKLMVLSGYLRLSGNIYNTRLQ
jgi:hypothetical protein